MYKRIHSHHQAERECEAYFKKSRSVPYALQPALDAELDRMQRDGIIEPIDNSKWATPLVIVPKSNGKIRVCEDFKVTINQCVETKLYPLPMVEDILAQLAGGKVFTKLDLSQAYLQLPVDKESKELLVINTPKGIVPIQPFALWSFSGTSHFPIGDGLCPSRPTSGMLFR